MSGNIYASGTDARGTHASDGPDYAAEREAIVTLRKFYPNTGAYELATLIHRRGFEFGTDNAVAEKTGHRPYYSILAVIRRYDANLAKGIEA